MEWKATALSLICKEVLTRNSGQLDANFLELHNNLNRINHHCDSLAGPVFIHHQCRSLFLMFAAKNVVKAPSIGMECTRPGNFFSFPFSKARAKQAEQLG